MASSRRDFIKVAALGAVGLSIGPKSLIPKAAARDVPRPNAMVHFGNGNDRKRLLQEVLQPLEKQIREGVKGKQVVIKPNCVWDDNRLCATDPDAIRAVLDFLKPFYKGTVVLAESTAAPAGTMKAFEDYEYPKVAKEYGLKLVDLNQDTYTTEWILGQNRYPRDIKIIDTFLDPKNYIISLTRLKTHNTVVVTLTTKNMVMASPLNPPKSHPSFVVNQYEKRKMHEGGPKGANYNIYQMAHKVHPSLCILDGFVGMEGNGPRMGTPVEHHVALAGFDMIAVDRIGLELMGVKYSEVGYLQWCSNAGIGQGDLDKIEVVGPDYRKFIRTYKLADNIEEQLGWKDPSPA